MLNQCQFIGNLGRDPDVRNTNGGDKVANFTIACSEKYGDKETTEWVRVVAFGNIVSVIEAYCSKGTRVFVQGKMQTRKWVNQSGIDQYSTEIVLSGFNSKLVLLGGKKNQDAQHGGSHIKPYAGYQSTDIDDLDDEIPF